MSLLAARVVVARPGFQVDVELDVAAGEVLALLGPNGAGKSTTLRALAGLEPAGASQVTLDGTVLDAAGVRVPPQRRDVGVVFQDYLLFPHLSALDNVAFGPRCRGVRRPAARRAALEWLDRLGLADVAASRPRQLSGGQQQRVALARALATRPKLLLLDEPLAALDASSRLSTRAELRRHLRADDRATVLISHDPLDAFTMADRVVVVEDGRAVQTGTPTEITTRPRTGYVAKLAGLNLYRGVASGDGDVALSGPGGGRLRVPAAPRGDVFVAFPPAAVALYRTRPDGSPRNVWLVEVTDVERYGGWVRVQLAAVTGPEAGGGPVADHGAVAGGGAAGGPESVAADVTPAAVADLGLLPGARVWAAVKATETHVYPA